MHIQDDTRTLYERIGGEENVRLLVQRFYHHMDTLPETQSIRWMHADNLQSAEEKLFLFLSGWMGGPSLYIEKYGHPRLRMRHLPFAIGAAARDQWMLCMKLALDEVVSDKPLRDELYAAFYGIADFMRNRDDGESA
ncbi:group II truncated hemoglobin [Mariprofundus erugo]|uniref:Group II truncated hemoglobin n=1 Tax=Mariprofundus erugo TaxID=2528639 RepID=A0A5R9GPR4_9PROT|nr:group II truncated hemoglobin [Mariprofundus erugo]TLS67588.1 group II truncated hemoglobin [Mariprofundus erugo]TLS74817.1 group II truncated hemoglobin [Mariprofundus erugo]